MAGVTPQMGARPKENQKQAYAQGWEQFPLVGHYALSYPGISIIQLSCKVA